MPGARREPALAVVIPCHDGQSLLPDCLAALGSQTLDPARFEVIVVETEGKTGASARAEDAAASSGLAVRHIYGPNGPAAKRNLGAGTSAAPYLAFTDPDCLPSPGWLEAGLRALEGGAALVQGRVEPPPGEPASRFGHTIWVTRETGLYEASNVFYARDAFEQAGGFPEHWFERIGVPFGEDAELGWAVRRAGGPTAFEPGALVHHRVFPAHTGRHLRDQLRAEHFPELVAAIPELRDTLLHHRVFLSPDTRTLWLALGGLLVSHRSPLGLLAPLPYLHRLVVRSKGARSRPFAVAALATSDLVRAAALLRGSLRARTPVL